MDTWFAAASSEGDSIVSPGEITPLILQSREVTNNTLVQAQYKSIRAGTPKAEGHDHTDTATDTHVSSPRKTDNRDVHGGHTHTHIHTHTHTHEILIQLNTTPAITPWQCGKPRLERGERAGGDAGPWLWP